MGQICKQAALRAYAELRSRGKTDPAAFDAAVAVYRHHHPESPRRDSNYIVAGWIEECDAPDPGYEVQGSA
ncbi:MAG: hypothetical protein HQ514_10490 [Rhodospirillales bacterium]|nr:hypothetical protein [Rhodospirillales bacterium]